jgi:hypothetical protein
MKLIDLAQVIRSKNAGPLYVTVDLMFPDRLSYERARQSPALAAESIARLYNVQPETVSVIPYAAAHAIKVTIESMNPARAATPSSVAAHSLYKQADPHHVYEPDGMVDFSAARYERLDDRRTRVTGATWHPAFQPTIKVEGAEWCGERAVLFGGSCDPQVIENTETIMRGVRSNITDILPQDPAQPYQLFFHIYGKGATSLFGIVPSAAEEIFFLVEIIAPTMPLARSVASVAKQYLLHHGFPGRLSTGGNIAFPFTPPELPVGPAFRYSIYHVVECDDLAAVFPVEMENVGA